DVDRQQARPGLLRPGGLPRDRHLARPDGRLPRPDDRGRRPPLILPPPGRAPRRPALRAPPPPPRPAPTPVRRRGVGRGTRGHGGGRGVGCGEDFVRPLNTRRSACVWGVGIPCRPPATKP